MAYSVKIDNNVLSLQGDLTKQTIQHDLFKAKASIRQHSELTINLGQLGDVDSAGLAWLINIMRDCRSAKIKLQWQNIPSNIMQLAKLSNAQDLFSTANNA